jgi:hypothetical protein
MRLQSLLYSTLNPPMRALLRSPFHGVASRNLAILDYHGRKSGRRFETPLSFVRDGSVVRFLSSHNTGWWKNFRDGPTPVEIEIGRKKISGQARVWETDSDHLRDGVRKFLTALPRDAVVYGIGLDSDRKPRESDIVKTANHVVLVEVELDRTTD